MQARCPRTLGMQQGFTYLWTLMLVAFMGLGLALASEVYTTSVQRDKERELIYIGRQFRNAIGQYYNANLMGGLREYPASLDDLIKDDRFPGVRRHLRKIYVDPMTGEPEWGLMQVGGRIVGVYSLSERTPIKLANFEAGELTFHGKTSYAEWIFTYPSDLLLRPDVESVINGAGQSDDGPVTENARDSVQ